MNRILIRLALLAAPLSIAQITPQVQAKPARKAATPRSVVDYFKLLPERYFVSDRGQVLADSSVDSANDYIKAPGNDGQPRLTVALFRHAGRVTVAVGQEYAGDFVLDLLRLKDGRWQNVTRELVPRYSEANFYRVPRYGTTMRVSKISGDIDDKPGAHLYDLAWRGGRFVIR